MTELQKVNAKKKEIEDGVGGTVVNQNQNFLELLISIQLNGCPVFLCVCDLITFLFAVDHFYFVSF